MTKCQISTTKCQIISPFLSAQRARQTSSSSPKESFLRTCVPVLIEIACITRLSTHQQARLLRSPLESSSVLRLSPAQNLSSQITQDLQPTPSPSDRAAT